MKGRLIKFAFIVTLVLSLLLTSFGSVAAAPSDEPSGLQRAIEAKNRHTDEILSVPGVNGIGVGLGENGEAVIIILTEKAGIHGVPSSIEGIPAFTEVSGVFVALAQPSDKVPSNKVRPPKNQAPVVTITSPIDGGVYDSGIPIHFEGTANDNEDGDMSTALTWESDGNYIGGGRSFDLPLTPGPHTITASVIDPGGKTGSDSVQITVGGSSPSDRWVTRPVPIGVSTGHPNITAGTIGARVTDGTNVYALSNNHVYADENQAIIGDNVLQPGVYDGGRNPIDKIGTLSFFVPIVFSRRANNEVDAAIAISSDILLGNSTPGGGYGTPSSTTMAANVSQSVKKYGRTTGETYGQVYMIDATIVVQYGSGLARFVHQIVITPGTFSAGGDSGSLIVDSESNKPVGLLFAGSSSYTIANPIQTVLKALSDEIGGGIILSIDGN